MMRELSLVVLFLAAFTVLFVDGVQSKDVIREAIQEGDKQKLLDLIANGTDINKCLDSEGSTPLSLAIGMKNEELALILIEKGADLNTSCAAEKHRSLLADATSMGFKTLVKVLLDKGMEIDDHVLWEVIRYDRTDILEFFIQNGFDPNKEYAVCNRTWLFRAVHDGKINIIKLLVKKGADIEYKDCEGFTALNGVCWHRGFLHQDEAEQNLRRGMELLIDSGANVNQADNIYKITPLMCASRWNSTSATPLVKKLIEKGANVNAMDENGTTPLLRVRNTDIAEILIKNGADVNAMDKWGNTPWSDASKYGNEKLAKLFLDRGADIHKGESLRKKARSE